MRMRHRVLMCLGCAALLLAIAAHPVVPTSSAAASPVDTAVRVVPVAPAMGADARLTRLVAAADDLYVIDAGPYHVRRYILNGLPYAELFTQVMRWKEGDNGLILGQPLDLFLRGERLFILDSLGTLWGYWGPDYGRALVPLRLQSNQDAPVAAAMHGSDLLLLDPARRRIWMYAPDAMGGYDTMPRSLLARGLPALAGAIRLAVSRDALLVLLRDGRVLALPWARPERVAVVRLPFRVTGLWASGTRTGLLIASRGEVALVALDGAVHWRVTLQGLDGEAITDVARSPAGALYVITHTRILHVQAAAPAP